MEFSFPPFPPNAHTELSNQFHERDWNIDSLPRCLCFSKMFCVSLTSDLALFITVRWSKKSDTFSVGLAAGNYRASWNVK